MFELQETLEFAAWIESLRDQVAKRRILQRLVRLATGHFGDAKPIEGGVSELRFHFGPGYRVYFFRRDDGVVIILLAGGDKDSQRRDIERAKLLADRERSA